METKQYKIPKFDFNFLFYWSAKRSGSTIDKRTWEAKQLIKEVRQMDFEKSFNVSNNLDIHYSLIYLSFKSMKSLFNIEFNN